MNKMEKNNGYKVAGEGENKKWKQDRNGRIWLAGSGKPLPGNQSSRSALFHKQSTRATNKQTTRATNNINKQTTRETNKQLLQTMTEKTMHANI